MHTPPRNNKYIGDVKLHHPGETRQRILQHGLQSQRQPYPAFSGTENHEIPILEGEEVTGYGTQSTEEVPAQPLRDPDRVGLHRERRDGDGVRAGRDDSHRLLQKMPVVRKEDDVGAGHQSDIVSAGHGAIGPAQIQLHAPRSKTVEHPDRPRHQYCFCSPQNT